jgi:hypothetical protein
MKHFRPFKSVFAGDGRYCGALIFTARGWDAHDADGKRVGCFEEDAKAIARLRQRTVAPST